MSTTIVGPDGKPRCRWCEVAPEFFLPTTVYAFMQAMGLINDHVAGCVIRDKVERARKRFKRPGR